MSLNGGGIKDGIVANNRLDTRVKRSFLKDLGNFRMVRQQQGGKRKHRRRHRHARKRRKLEQHGFNHGYLMQLPVELLEHIIKMLPVRDICSLVATCKAFRTFISRHSLWKVLLRRDYPFHVDFDRQNVDLTCRFLERDANFFNTLTHIRQNIACRTDIKARPHRLILKNVFGAASKQEWLRTYRYLKNLKQPDYSGVWCTGSQLDRVLHIEHRGWHLKARHIFGHGAQFGDTVYETWRFVPFELLQQNKTRKAWRVIWLGFEDEPRRDGDLVWLNGRNDEASILNVGSTIRAWQAPTEFVRHCRNFSWERIERELREFPEDVFDVYNDTAWHWREDYLETLFGDEWYN